MMLVVLAGAACGWVADAWQCVPCDAIVQFGYLFAYEHACAPVPVLACSLARFLTGARFWSLK